MFEPSPMSCAVVHIYQLYGDMEPQILDFCEQMYGKLPKLGYRGIAVWSNSIVSATGEPAGWSGQLVKFIKENGFGTVERSQPIKNGRYQGVANTIAVWTWNIDNDKLKAWWTKKKAEKDKALAALSAASIAGTSLNY